MDFKKFISGISALAVALSVFAGLAVTVSAEEETRTIIYSEKFDSPVDAGHTGGTAEATYLGATTPQNTHNSGVFGIYCNDGGDAHIATQDISAMPNYKDESGENASYVDVSFDFKFDAGSFKNEKSINIALNGTYPTNKYNNTTTDKSILVLNMKYNTSATSVNIGGNEYKDNLIESSAKDYSGTGDTTGWVHLDARIDFVTSKVTYTLKKGEQDIAKDVTVAFANTSAEVLHSIALYTNKNYAGIYLDNLEVTRVDKEVKKANITFTGDATSVKVNSSEAIEGIDLPAGTYDYIATADNKVTKYGSFTISDEEAEAGSATVDIQLEDIPQAPENKNDQGEKLFDKKEFVNDGFGTYVWTPINHEFDLKAGDKVVLEYDAYVTGENSFNTILKGTNNATGANVEFIATKDKVLVRNENSGGKYTDHGTYTPEQWVHVKLEIDVANPSNTHSPVGDIRTSNVKVTITPTDGNPIVHDNITARNLAEGYPESTTDVKRYSFTGIQFNGKANIANAEIYAIGTREEATVSKAFGFDTITAADGVKTVKVTVDGEVKTGTIDLTGKLGDLNLAIIIKDIPAEATTVTAVIE